MVWARIGRPGELAEAAQSNYTTEILGIIPRAAAAGQQARGWHAA